MIVRSVKRKNVQVVFEDSDLATHVVQMASTFVGQASEDGVILTICQTTPPVILGSPDQQREQIESLSTIKATILARFALTKKRAEELIDILRETLQKLNDLEAK